MVVAAEVAGELSLAVVGSSELTAPDDKGVFEEPPALEIHHQGGGGPVGFLALAGQAFWQTAVLIPARMVKLDEANAALREPSSHEAIGGEGSRFSGFLSVFLVDVVRLRREVGNLRNRGLHFEGHLVLGNPIFDRRVGVFLQLGPVKILQAVKHSAAVRIVDACWIVEVEDRVLAGAETDTLVTRCKEAASP